jgi:hypothetical protein
MITLTVLIIVLGLGWTVHKAWTLAVAFVRKPAPAKVAEVPALN